MGAQVFRDFSKPYPVMVRGKGVFLYDKAGREYLDAVGGISVVNIGHGVPEVIAAMQGQADQVAFVHGGSFANEPAMALAEELAGWAPPGLGRVLLLSGGSEATETAMKLAHQYHRERGKPGKVRIVSRWTSYHGNTLGALSMSGRTAWRKAFAPYLLPFPKIHPPYCYRCPYGGTYPSCRLACAEDLERTITFEGAETIAAFIAEPVIGTSAAGVTPPPEYYPRIRAICDRHDVLFIADEVITGAGRTGTRFAVEHWPGVVPDMIATAKGLSSGYAPLAAVIGVVRPEGFHAATSHLRCVPTPHGEPDADVSLARRRVDSGAVGMVGCRQEERRWRTRTRRSPSRMGIGGSGGLKKFQA